MAPITGKKKARGLQESDIEKVEVPVENPFKKDTVAYFCRVKGVNRLKPFSSKKLQKIAPQKIIAFYEKSKYLVFHSEDDLRSLSKGVDPKSQAKHQRSAEEPVKESKRSSSRKIEKIESIDMSGQNFKYQVKFYGKESKKVYSDAKMIAKYPQETIDFLTQRCTFEEAQGPTRDLLIRKWGL